MSIRPIDMQVTVKGANEIVATKQNALNRQENQLLNVQQQAAEEATRELRSVKSDIKTDSSELKRRSREEEEGKNNARGGERGDGKKQRGEERPDGDGAQRRYPKDKGRHIDIRI